MSEFAPTNDDLEGFARFVGISGTDIDLFHEAYYGLDTDIWEEEVEEEIPTSYKSKGM